MYRVAVHVLTVILFCGTLTSITWAGTPPGFECDEYITTARGIVTPMEWEVLNSITQEYCEALFYPFDKMPHDALMEYLESGYFVNDLALFEHKACEHFREFHCKNCDPSLSCAEINEISEKYYSQERRGWWGHVMRFWDWLTEVVHR